MICDELIFPSTITQIIRHFSIPYPKMTTPLASLAPSTSSPSSSASGVTLDEIITQLQRMDALFDTFSDELCQVNTYVGHIARQQAHLGGFIESPSPSPEASEDEDDSNSDANEDKDASSSSDNKMTA